MKKILGLSIAVNAIQHNSRMANKKLVSLRDSFDDRFDGEWSSHGASSLDVKQDFNDVYLMLESDISDKSMQVQSLNQSNQEVVKDLNRREQLEVLNKMNENRYERRRGAAVDLTDPRYY